MKKTIVGLSHSKQYNNNMRKKSLEEFFVAFYAIETVSSSTLPATIKTIQSIESLISLDEKERDQFFELFRDLNVTAGLEALLASPIDELHLQILNTFSFLVQNVAKEEHMFYFLSHHALTAVITHDFNFANSEIVISYFAFLKSMAIRMNKSTINLFFNPQMAKFPLYARAIQFYNYPDSIIQGAVRTITLNIYQLKNPEMLQVFSTLPNVLYFAKIACHLMEMWLLIEKVSRENKKVEQQIKILLEDSTDLLIYIDEVMQSLPELSEIIANCLWYFAINPFVISNLLKTFSFRSSIAVQILYRIATTINYTPMSTAIAIILCASHIPKEWKLQINELPPKIPGFSYTWSLSSSTITKYEYALTTFNENLDIFLGPHFLPIYFKTISEEYSRERDELQVSHSDYQIERKNLSKKYLEKIVDILEKEKLDLEKDHLQWSQGLGTPLGIFSALASDKTTRSIIQYSQKIIETEKNLSNIVYLEHSVHNPVAGILYDLLSSGINSKIITTAGLVMHLINSFETKYPTVTLSLSFQLCNTSISSFENTDLILSGAISSIISSLETNFSLPFITFDTCVSLMHKFQQHQKEKLEDSAKEKYMGFLKKLVIELRKFISSNPIESVALLGKKQVFISQEFSREKEQKKAICHALDLLEKNTSDPQSYEKLLIFYEFGKKSFSDIPDLKLQEFVCSPDTPIDSEIIIQKIWESPHCFPCFERSGLRVSSRIIIFNDFKMLMLDATKPIHFPIVFQGLISELSYKMHPSDGRLLQMEITTSQSSFKCDCLCENEKQCLKLYQCIETVKLKYAQHLRDSCCANIGNID